MDQETRDGIRGWLEAGALDMTLTGPCGSTVNFNPSCSVFPKVGDVDAVDTRMRARVDPRRLARSATSMRRHYPQHDKEVFEFMNRRALTVGNLGTRRRPWATTGGVFLATGQSHHRSEYRPQAESDFRHFLKKAYRRMRLSSGMSECTERSGDSDPDRPEFLRKRLRRAKRRGPPQGSEGDPGAAESEPGGPPGGAAPAAARRAAIRFEDLPRGKGVVRRPSTAAAACPVNSLGEFARPPRRSAVKTGYIIPGTAPAQLLEFPPPPLYPSRDRNSYWQRRTQRDETGSVVPDNDRHPCTSLDFVADSGDHCDLRRTKRAVPCAAAVNGDALCRGGVPGFTCTAELMEAAARRAQTPTPRPTASASRRSRWSHSTLRRIRAAAEAQLLATQQADEASAAVRAEIAAHGGTAG